MSRIVNWSRNVDGILMITITWFPSLISESAIMLVIALGSMVAIGLPLIVAAVAVLRDRGTHGQGENHDS